ncbi:rod shape-determining protein MreD [Thalassotalea mangrovi]|uniref:Rod shape-determining protein MreD n=1 Tax=Thalassotalea mangrovi TaxID=2572245 RepID=A0A4U1BCV9_9GAMM|nr:rod shape-determining protein MreD [Thalassotalea mangrovi]TKB47875.1 rod shape-determining protein MreD [Thalassotalea mangrovi]
MKAKNNTKVIYITILISLIFSIIPLPIALDAYRPNWALLVLCYWSMALPNRLGVLTAWLVGLLLDVLLGSVLGINAFALAMVIYVMVNNYQTIRNFSLWQQSLIIGLFTALYHLLVFWIQRFVFGVDFSMTYLIPVVTSASLWWVIFLLLRKIRRQFKVR